MKKYLITLLAFGLILSCKLFDEASEQKAQANILIEMDSKKVLERGIEDSKSTNSINKVTVVIYDIEHSYSTVNNNYNGMSIQSGFNITDFENYWVYNIEVELDRISNDNCSVEKRQNLTVSGNSASGEVEIEPGVKYFLVGLFENNELIYTGHSTIRNFKVGDSQTISITAAEINTPPNATFTISPSSGTIATIFNVDASNSSDNEDATSALQVRWDWTNNGSYDTNYSTDKTTNHQFGSSGTYTVKMEVKDTGSLTDTATRNITVTEGCTAPGQVTLSSPSNGATGVSTSPLLDWNYSVPNVTSYSLQVDDNSNFSSPIVNENVQTYSQSFISGLSNSTTYYWRVSATNVCGTGSWSSTWSFTTEDDQVKAPSKAVNPSPSNGATNQSTNVDLSWTNGGGAASYNIYFGTDSSPDSGEDKGHQTGTSYDPGTLAYSTIYYWRIDAINSAGATTGNVWSFTTGAQPVSAPSAATNPSPSNGANNQSKDVDVSWSNGGGATSYNVYFGTDSSPDSGENKGNQSSASYNPGTLSYSTNYYWRIDAVNSAGTTTGTVWSFTTEGSCSVPPFGVLNTPINGATGVSTSPTLDWFSLADTETYKLQVDDNSNFSSPNVNSSGIINSQQTISGLSNSTTYYWRVRGTNACGDGAWSSVRSFTTISSTETVSAPGNPIGPTAGQVGSSMPYFTGGSTSNLGHSVEYRFDWSDGSYSSWSTSDNSSHSWSSAGSYSVKAQARCATHTSVVSSWISGTTVSVSENETISTPNKPTSTDMSGYIGNETTTYTFSTGGSSSNLGHSIQYRFNWGDGSYSSWSSSTSASYSWGPGSSFGGGQQYLVTTQARCATHTSIISGWSSSRVIAIVQ